MFKNGILDVCLRLVIVLLIAITFSRVVELEPKIDRFFFFAADDPASIEAGKVDKLFSEQDQVVVSVSSATVNSPKHYQKIKWLSEKILSIPEVTDVSSLSHGPKNLRDAISSPVWNNFLIGKKKKSSLIVIRLKKGSKEKEVIPLIEAKIMAAKEKGCDIQMSGMPFILEKIRMHLEQDMKVFSSSAIIIFGLLLLFIFSSTRILLGTMVACFTAIMVTLITMSSLNMSLGILTTNLSTIVFILTQSHIIFLTANWRRIGEKEKISGKELSIRAMQRTFTPSFWCMATTLLGFLSLLLVPAKPLKDLGLGGAIGTLVSILAAYLIYPAFLSWAQSPKKRKKRRGDVKWIKWLGKQKFLLVSLASVIIIALVGRGIYKLDVDPGLHEYFAPQTEIRRGLERVDQNGGSSILSFVISNKSQKTLDDKDSYKRMLKLQNDISSHPSVGSLIALPHLIAESDRHPLSFLVSIKKRLEILSSPKYGNPAKSFITPDHKQAHYMMRLYETKKEPGRQEVIKQLKFMASQNDFNVNLVGGVYSLQEQLAELIKTSVLRGIAMLLLLFLVIAYIVSRSISTSFAMVLGIALIPLSILGIVGFSATPLDIFATPAVNVCLGIAVDTLIHLAMSVRLNAKNHKVTWRTWIAARKEQFTAIITSTSIVAAGFSIFTLSYFPPTYRFGIQIVIGTLLAAIVALVIFPALASFNTSKK